MVPDELAHTGAPPSGLQATPQAPQLDAVLSFTHLPLQSTKPALHENVQVALAHTGVAFALLVVQACPQAPQL